MRRLLNIAFAGGVVTLAGLLIRRLLAQAADEGGPPAQAGGSSGTREQLYKEATHLGIRGRSKMNKQQLQEAVDAAKSGGSS